MVLLVVLFDREDEKGVRRESLGGFVSGVSGIL